MPVLISGCAAKESFQTELVTLNATGSNRRVPAPTRPWAIDAGWLLRPRARLSPATGMRADGVRNVARDQRPEKSR